MNRMKRKGNGRKGNIGLACSSICGGKWGGVVISKFCLRVNISYVMICAVFGVNVREVDSVGVGYKIRVSPSTKC